MDKAECYTNKDHAGMKILILSFNPLLIQEEVLSELHSHVKSHPPPLEIESTSYTLRYLESCNLVFERGLSHERIHTSDRKVLHNIQGYIFFCDWLDDILKKGK
jgi:hypothetical protein